MAPLQNRVTPFGEIIAAPARGTLMGNRGGRIHNPATRSLLPKKRWATKSWIICQLSFRNRQRTVMDDGYTELFFLDEWTALAAGHRPCFECRRGDAKAFAAAWALAFDLEAPPRAPHIDAILHGERLGSRVQYTPSSIPNVAMVAVGSRAYLIWEGVLLEWTDRGYAAPREQVDLSKAVMLTPSSTIKVLTAGYCGRPTGEPTVQNRYSHS